MLYKNSLWKDVNQNKAHERNDMHDQNQASQISVCLPDACERLERCKEITVHSEQPSRHWDSGVLTIADKAGND
jgi:hypothetical protein